MPAAVKAKLQHSLPPLWVWVFPDGFSLLSSWRQNRLTFGPGLFKAARFWPESGFSIVVVFASVSCKAEPEIHCGSFLSSQPCVCVRVCIHWWNGHESHRACVCFSLKFNISLLRSELYKSLIVRSDLGPGPGIWRWDQVWTRFCFISEAWAQPPVVDLVLDDLIVLHAIFAFFPPTGETRLVLRALTTRECVHVWD